ncbi:thioesterase domain-containing protein [Acidovorax sp. NCPPB 3576]|uniref:thioesterase domain-containing protein n=1 Tax=Acidovorax sp. NCPPB 3576 TaxID=2940488 RepID=UPI00234B78E1|nr:thioesterase domain-containing protein [Acidovorax sp. NCPPB 3576]WCM89836.1 alpha/beta hydrolase [Acidovorax sp. NCPPB 3576]
MTWYVIPGPSGSHQHERGDVEKDSYFYNKRDFVGHGLSPGPLGTCTREGYFASQPIDLFQDRQSLEEKAQAFLTKTFVPGEKIKGTVFMGGAGMDGAYIDDMTRAFARKGIALIRANPQKWSGGTLMDAAVGVEVFRTGKAPIQVLLDRFSPRGSQFNLIGYSYGSLVAAQVAINYAQSGSVVDHLVLIGSPISSGFLQQLRGASAIKKLIIIDLTKQGDPLHAGMSRVDLLTSTPRLGPQMLDSSGHFYYAQNSDEGKKRRDDLVDHLYRSGLR